MIITANVYITIMSIRNCWYSELCCNIRVPLEFVLNTCPASSITSSTCSSANKHDQPFSRLGSSCAAARTQNVRKPFSAAELLKNAMTIAKLEIQYFRPRRRVSYSRVSYRQISYMICVIIWLVCVCFGFDMCKTRKLQRYREKRDWRLNVWRLKSDSGQRYATRVCPLLTDWRCFCMPLCRLSLHMLPYAILPS